METSHIRNIIFLAAFLVAVTSSATIIASQATSQGRPSFEVASIRPNPSAATGMPWGQSGNRFTAPAITLKRLIGYAYRIAPWQIKGGPGWVDSQQWSIEAKADEKITSAAPKPRDPLTPDVIALMLQSLLEDRFKLRIQRQPKESPVYDLVVAKGGPKIKLDADQSPPAHVDLASLRGDNEMPRGNASIGPSSIKARAISITDFINRCLLSRTDRPIIDCTNLKGLYNFKMQWSSEDSALGGSPIARVDINFGPAFFTAMKEQLGLQLESGKGLVDFIVITSVEKPSEN